jgi:hypothetical protein
MFEYFDQGDRTWKRRKDDLLENKETTRELFTRIGIPVRDVMKEPGYANAERHFERNIQKER